MSDNRHIRRRIVSDRSQSRAVATVRFSQLLVAVIGFVAVALQSFVVQTHIHVPQGAARIQPVSFITVLAASAGIGDVSTAQTGAPADQYPVNRDPANCPLCKELTHSGQYISSASVLAALPFAVSVNFIVFREIAPSLFAASHNWRGRAPPPA
jgi:hypothetical protein